MLKWLAGGIAVAWICQQGVMVAMLSQPWAPFWFSGKTGAMPESGGLSLPLPIPDPSNLNPTPGFVSDAQRYQFALTVGWSLADAITATAISIAEDGSGNPAALSARNTDGSFDYGLLQINSAHWPSCGGQQALADPLTNFRCGHAIYLRQGFCAWSTYEPSCGLGHNGSYRAFLPRAVAASQVLPPSNQG